VISLFLHAVQAPKIRRCKLGSVQAPGLNPFSLLQKEDQMIGDSSTSWVRPTAVAGAFYPNHPAALAAMVEKFLGEARQAAEASGNVKPPQALIAPHAGYIYSGPIAASAYVRLEALAGTINRVVLFGPSHRTAVAGLATSSAEAFDTPMGAVPLDRDAIEQILSLPQVHIVDEAHEREHSLEVHLPFLIRVLGGDSFKLVPLAMGDVSGQQVAEVIELLWQPQTLVIISSDLSHYHDYETANRLDEATSRAIERFHPHEISHEQACGRPGILGLMQVARQHGLQATTVDRRNSGDTGGRAKRLSGSDEVVGYGAYIFS